MSIADYTVTDADGDSLEIRNVHDSAYLACRDGEDASFVAVVVSPEQRQAAAQALAGPDYRVVPPRESDDGWIAVQRSEYERLLDRDQYPRVRGTCPACGVGPLFLGEGGHVTCSWVDCKEPEAADETLQIGLTAQPDQNEALCRQNEQLRAEVVALREREAQPDPPMQEDLRAILRALGLGDHARPYSPHECVTRDVLPAIYTLRRALGSDVPQPDRPAYTDEDWRQQIGRVLSLLGIEDGVIRRPPVDIIDTIRGKIDNLYSLSQRLGHERDDLRKQLHEAEAQAADDHSRYTYDATCPKCRDLPAQPDRPEPVDPASVRVGQVVEIEADDGPWMVRGRVVGTESATDDGRPLALALPGVTDHYWPDLRKATVRILRRPEPEVDEAAVEALERAFSSVGIYLSRETKRKLIRDHGVQVGVSE